MPVVQLSTKERCRRSPSSGDGAVDACRVAGAVHLARPVAVTCAAVAIAGGGHRGDGRRGVPGHRSFRRTAPPPPRKPPPWPQRPLLTMTTDIHRCRLQPPRRPSPRRRRRRHRRRRRR